MDMVELVGKRVRVNGKGGTPALGLGTYLWDDEILLDTGKKILGKDCSWVVIHSTEKVPGFAITLQGDTRVFEGTEHLRNTGTWLFKGEKLLIVEVRTIGWNHGRYVAGKFFYRGEPYWCIMSEVDLPVETPYLRAVS